jgi:hypothetical protein
LPITTRDLGEPGYVAALMGDRNVIYPSSIVRVGVSGTAPGIPLRAGVENLWVGPRRASETNTLDHGGSYTLGSYAMLDMSLSTAGFEMLERRETVLMLKLRNLLDVAGPDPGFAGVDYPLLPRSVMLQLRQEL